MSATDDLIGNLASQAGAEFSRSPASFSRAFLLSTLLSLIAALALSGVCFGFRDSVPVLATQIPFLVKVTSGLLLAIGAFLLARRTALPGSDGPSWLLILPGIAPFLLHAVFDPWGPPASGYRETGNCALDIALLSLPALWLTLRALKSAAPTRPLQAGALAGLLAGAMGVAGHAFACENDGGLSVLMWYGGALLFMTGLGALIGRKALRW